MRSVPAHLGTLILALAIPGCTASPSQADKADDTAGAGDGVDDPTESDPDADPDEDGLSNAEEADLGTDAGSADSDGDGYLDGWEVEAGSDPLDAESGIYIGGWPYNPDKESLVQEEESTWATLGEQAPRFILQDQFGEMVDLYDFASQGKPVLIDLSGAWCYWCREMAALLDHQPNAFEDFPGDWYERLPLAVDAGDILWITVLDADRTGGPPTEATIAEWYETWANPRIPVLMDEEGVVTDWIDPDSYPTVVALDEDLSVMIYPGNYEASILVALYHAGW